MASLNARALSFLMVLQAVTAYQFTVGGGNWWVPPSGAQEAYNQWAGRNRFQVGDLLVFKYNPNEDSVLQVNQQDYEACKTTSPVASFKDGNTVFKFPGHGPFYFISGNDTNCLKGEKLITVVMAPRNTIRVGSPSPTPAAVAPSVATPAPSHSAATPSPVPSPSRSVATPSPAPSPAPSKAAPSPAPTVAPPTPVPAPAASVPSLSPPSLAPSPSAPIVASPQPSQENGGEPSLQPAASSTESASLAATPSSVSAATTAMALLMWGLAMATF